MTALAHLLITRFSYRGTEWHSGQDPLAPERLARRLELFKVTALPSVLSQTHKDFLWVLIVDPALPDALLNELKDLTAPHPRVHFHRYSSRDDLTACDWLRPCLQDAPGYIVTTLLDDDDMLFSGFAAAVRQWMQSVSERSPQPLLGLLGCGKALQWDYVASRRFPAGYTKPWQRHIDVPGVGPCAFPVSAGFTVLVKWPEVNRTVLDYEHLWAPFYFADEAALAGLRRGSDSLVDNLILPKRAMLAAAAEAAGRDLDSALAEPPFQHLPGDRVQAVMVNHSHNDQVLRLFEKPAMPEEIAAIDSLRGFALDLAAARQYARPLPRSLPVLASLLRLAWQVEGKRGPQSLFGRLKRGATAAARILSGYLAASVEAAMAPRRPNPDGSRQPRSQAKQHGIREQ